jgi:tetratricopeptide (TPR) repeat protein
MHEALDNGARLGERAVSVAQRVKALHYRTAAVVGSFILSAQFGLDRGFDEYDDRLPSIGGPVLNYDLRRDAAHVSARAERWILSAGEQPFFLWAHFYDPHAPYAAPTGINGRDAYDTAVTTADAGVGRLLNALNRAGLASRTAVLLTADHGESLGEHGERQHGLLVYDGVIRVPLIIAVPGLGPHIVQTQVRHIDLAPTIAVLAGAADTKDMPGHDLMRFVEHGDPPPKSSSIASEDEAYGEAWYGKLHFGWSELRFLRADGWKFIDAPEPELYDLKHDPNESHNIALTHAELAAAMKQRLAAIALSRPAPSLSSSTDSVTLDRLRSLGYVRGPGPSSIPSKTAGDPKKMVQAFELYVEQLNAGIDSLAASRPDDAVRYFRGLVRGYPTSFEAHYYLGYGLAAGHRETEALGEYQRAIELNPTYAVAYFDTAKALSALGRHQAASKQIDAGLRLEPRSVYGHMMAGVVAWARGANSVAVQAFTMATELNPEEPRAFANLGEACMRVGDFIRARNAFQKLVELGYASAAAHYNLGTIAERLGNIHEARNEYSKALASDPHLEEARRALKKLGDSQ